MAGAAKITSAPCMVDHIVLYLPSGKEIELYNVIVCLFDNYIIVRDRDEDAEVTVYGAFTVVCMEGVRPLERPNELKQRAKQPMFY